MFLRFTNEATRRFSSRGLGVSTGQELFAVPPSDGIVARAARLADGLGRLGQGRIHVVLLDLALPDSPGLDSATLKLEHRFSLDFLNSLAVWAIAPVPPAITGAIAQTANSEWRCPIKVKSKTLVASRELARDRAGPESA